MPIYLFIYFLQKLCKWVILYIGWWYVYIQRNKCGSLWLLNVGLKRWMTFGPNLFGPFMWQTKSSVISDSYQNGMQINWKMLNNDISDLQFPFKLKLNSLWMSLQIKAYSWVCDSSIRFIYCILDLTYSFIICYWTFSVFLDTGCYGWCGGRRIQYDIKSLKFRICSERFVF